MGFLSSFWWLLSFSLRGRSGLDDCVQPRDSQQSDQTHQDHDTVLRQWFFSFAHSLFVGDYRCIPCHHRWADCCVVDMEISLWNQCAALKRDLDKRLQHWLWFVSTTSTFLSYNFQVIPGKRLCYICTPNILASEDWSYTYHYELHAHQWNNLRSQLWNNSTRASVFSPDIYVAHQVPITEDVQMGSIHNHWCVHRPCSSYTLLSYLKFFFGGTYSVCSNNNQLCQMMENFQHLIHLTTI